NDGREVKDSTRKKYPQLGDNLGWKISNEQYYFMESITWSFISSSKFGVRYSSPGSIFDVAGSSLFPDHEDLYYIIGFMCSKLAYDFLKILNPTMNFQVRDVGNLPFIFSETHKPEADSLVQQNISISKTDWDSFETSWDFEIHPLLDKDKQGQVPKT